MFSRAFKKLHNKKAQVIMGEYVLTFFLIMGVMATIMIYFKRAVQARIYDSREAMNNMIKTRTGAYYNGPVYGSYEPYYTESTTAIARNASQNEYLEESWFNGARRGSGRYVKDFNEATLVDSFSETKPPKDVDYLP